MADKTTRREDMPTQKIRHIFVTAWDDIPRHDEKLSTLQLGVKKEDVDQENPSRAK